MDKLLGWIILPWLYGIGYWFVLWAITLVGLFLIYGKNLFEALELADDPDTPLSKLRKLPKWKAILLCYVLALIVFVLHNLYFYGIDFFVY
jgi:hypothetical protein